MKSAVRPRAGRRPPHGNASAVDQSLASTARRPKSVGLAIEFVGARSRGARRLTDDWPRPQRVARIYDQYVHLEEIREALERWAAKLRAFVGEPAPVASVANVVPLASARR
jgi:hypothetical protein